MTHDSSLGPELLKQNGVRHQQLLDEERAAIREILDRERRRARIAKWIAILALLVAVSGPGFLILRSFLPHPAEHAPLAPAVVRLLLLFCIGLPIPAFLVGCVSGIFAVVYSRSADRQALLAHLAQVETILRQSPPAPPAGTAVSPHKPGGDA